MSKFSDRVFGANVDKETIEIFNALQKGQYEFIPGESIDEQTKPSYTKYLGEKTTFARMWVALQATGSDAKEDIFYHSINDNKYNSYEPNEPIADKKYFVENTENPYLKPTAGITSITSKTEGSLGAVKRTNVEFVVHNKQDFDEIYLPFFLRPGSTVVVDYGWSDNNVPLYNIESVLSNTDTELKEFKKFIYDFPKSGSNEQIGWIYKNKGLVNTNVGVVTSYNSKVNPNGSFECSVELVSQNATILDNEISADNNLKFIFVNKFEEILLDALKGENSISLSQPTNYNALTSSGRREAYKLFFTRLQRSNTLGIISEKSQERGVYFESNTVNGSETLYISFGNLVGLFLNNFVAKNKDNDVKYEINFKIDDYYVRYSDELYSRQTTIMNGNEELPVFLLPSKWDSVDKDKTSTNDFKTPVMPLKELFVSVPIIKEAFQKKQTVNDAINFILTKINIDSYGVFDLKMVSPNKSFSEIGIQDNNLLPVLETEDNKPFPSNLLKFNVTSGDGIVSNMDYSFSTPKGALQNMLAIGNNTHTGFFDVASLDNLNFLNVLKDKTTEDKDARIRSLPVSDLGQSDDKTNTTDIDIQVPNDFFPNEDQLSSTDWDLYTSAVEQAYENAGKPEVKGEQPVKQKRNEYTLEAGSDRDYWGKEAKRIHVLSANEESISPILPVNLTITVYGNTFLNIGDIFTIDFLPKSYEKHVYFQIMGVEDKIDSKWETTYTTQYRVNPLSKDIPTKSSESSDIPEQKERKTVFPISVIRDFARSFVNPSVLNSLVDKIPISTDTDKDVSSQFEKIGLLVQDVSEDRLDTGIQDGYLSNVLDKTQILSEVRYPDDVRGAYALTRLLFEYAKEFDNYFNEELANKTGRKVKYLLSNRDGQGLLDGVGDLAKSMEVGKIEGTSIIFDIDWWNGKADDSNSPSVLSQNFVIPLSNTGWNLNPFAIADDQDVTVKIMEEQAKKDWYKDFKKRLEGNVEVDVVTDGDVLKNGKEDSVNFKRAPIIRRMRIKTTALASQEPTEFYAVEIKSPPGINLPYNIRRITVPKWFVKGDISAFRDKLINYYRQVPRPLKASEIEKLQKEKEEGK